LRSGLGQRRRHALGSRFNVIGTVAYSRQNAVDPAPRERPHGVVAADLAQLAHRGNGQVVVRVALLRPSLGGEPIAFGRPAASVVLPGGGGTGLRIAHVEQGIQMPAHTCRGNSQLLADFPRCNGSRLQQELDDRATGVAIVARCRRRGGSRLGTEFHNTIVTEFRNRV